MGTQLRRLRETSKITREQAGYAIRGSHSKISRMEGGRSGFKMRDVEDLLTLYGLAGQAERAPLLLLAEQANQPGWWQEYRDLVPDWFEEFLGLEHDAELIRTYEIQYVPGLLQTEQYARAVIARGHGGEARGRVDLRVALRMRRQEYLVASGRRLWVIVDEGALRRVVGGREVMRAQLGHLVEMAGLAHVTLQVLPFSVEVAVGGVGPVTLLRFPQAELSDIVYLEHLAGAQYLTKDSEVGPYRRLLDELSVHAPPPTATPEILREIMAEL
ncbi:helix-turn-helix transcriptional regulator [Nonomuraea sp. MCN248]|uniref:Helix-turn-helix transcriptional regulator n=1 Tax=Nonomuraea corallina TaxID=2989783 RepID=A0ABT4S4T4_9ACTN|nr:helix-turn-helix transcriptional regulator [Nonomuraea corallina]MDA0632206.1 helix-turn-helix transcriptional regulator [Nonomuraea corallina]